MHAKDNNGTITLIAELHNAQTVCACCTMTPKDFRVHTEFCGVPRTKTEKSRNDSRVVS